MKSFILKYKLRILLIFLSAAVCVFIYLAFFISPINGCLTDYVKADENNGHTIYYSPEQFLDYDMRNFDMSMATGMDIIRHPEDYTAYWVVNNICNTSVFPIYNLNASLYGDYDDLWLDSTSLYECCSLDLEPGEVHNGGVLVIIKTADKTDEEIDRLIRSVNIAIGAQNFLYIQFGNSAIIRF